MLIQCIEFLLNPPFDVAVYIMFCIVCSHRNLLTCVDSGLLFTIVFIRDSRYNPVNSFLCYPWHFRIAFFPFLSSSRDNENFRETSE